MLCIHQSRKEAEAAAMKFNGICSFEFMHTAAERRTAAVHASSAADSDSGRYGYRVRQTCPQDISNFNNFSDIDGSDAGSTHRTTHCE